ncbi:hypothetical protein GGI12_005691, partial [Dipsacomyces acuminosporus]
LSDGSTWGKGLLLSKPATASTDSGSSGNKEILRPTAALVQFLESLCQLVPRHSAAPSSVLVEFLHGSLALARLVLNAPSDLSSLSEKNIKSWGCLVKQIRGEGGWAMRLVERIIILLQRRWYWDVQCKNQRAIESLSSPHASIYQRPKLPTGLVAPMVPTVLPFHTFTYPLDSREVRLISHRNALRLSFTTLGGSAPWLPSYVYPPPPPPSPYINIGYVSSDFNNHPLSHLMQSVFGMHNRQKFRVFCYATTPPDGTSHRQKIERESDCFVNCSQWSTQRIVEQIVSDRIHILVNLNGYTKGARNEIFAARPAPVLVAFMGFAGTLGAGWCDYVVTDPIVCPPWTVRCEVRAERERRALALGKRPSASAARQPEMQERRRLNGFGWGHLGSKLNAADNPASSDDDYDGTIGAVGSNGVSSEVEAVVGAVSAIGAPNGIGGSSSNSSAGDGARRRGVLKERLSHSLEWRGDLCFDFGELDPEEADPAPAGSSAADISAASGANGSAAPAASPAHAKFDHVDAAADERKDEAGANDWVYTERMIYMPHTYFVNDHRQGFREDEELRELQTAEELWLAEHDAR